MPTENRKQQRETFLLAHGWGEAKCDLLAADASFRHYYRLSAADGTRAVLMDAPPDKEDTRPFTRITCILEVYGIHAPHIRARDEELGFLLLEDMGDARLSRVLQQKPEQELTLYTQAMDILVTLYKQRATYPHTEVKPYDEKEYQRELGIFTEWWVPHYLGDQAAQFTERYDTIWQKILQEASLYQGTLVLRDYHADNLMVLEDGGLGVLDYQDALMGDPAYDVVSLLEDARRDVSETTVQACLRYYLDKTAQKEAEFMQRYAVLGAQRNLKILGIFMRLCVRDGKPNYLSLLPRVWGHVQHDLQHPLLAELRALMDEMIPHTMRKDVPALGKVA